MYFVKEQGIIVNKSELAAVLSFVGEGERLSGIGITISDGKLLVQASNGHAAIYHHGDALDGKGQPYDGRHTYQVTAEALTLLRKSMETKDEAVLIMDKKGRLTAARIRDMESSTVRGEFSLLGAVDEQLAIEMVERIPARPPSRAGGRSEVGIAPSLLSLLKVVGRAAETDTCRITLPHEEVLPVYCEVAHAGELCDNEAPRWVVVIMPKLLHAVAEEEAAEREAKA